MPSRSARQAAGISCSRSCSASALIPPKAAATVVAMAVAMGPLQQGFPPPWWPKPASPSACSPASGATWTRPWTRWRSRWSAGGKSSICASSPSSNGWRSHRHPIYSAATTAIPASCSRPVASAWHSPPSRRPCSGPWSRAAGRTTADQSWNTFGICTRWWIGWRIGARSPSRAITRRCYSSLMASIRARW